MTKEPMLERRAYVMPRQESSLRDILFVLFRHRKKILFIFLAISAIAIFNAITTPDKFRSEAKILVRIGRNIEQDPSIDQAVGISQNRMAEVKTESDILTASTLIDQVLDGVDVVEVVETSGTLKKKSVTVGVSPERVMNVMAGNPDDKFLDFKPTERNTRSEEEERIRSKVHAHIEKNLEVLVGIDNNIIGVSFTTLGKEIAHDILDALIKAYEKEHIQAHKQLAPQAIYVEQLEAAKLALNDTEQEFASFANRFGIVSINDQKQFLIEQQLMLESKVADIKGQIESSNAKILSYEKSLQDMPTTISREVVSGLPNYGKGYIKLKYIDVKNELNDILSRYHPSSRAAQQAQINVDMIDRILDDEPENYTNKSVGANTSYYTLEASLKNELASLSGSESSLPPILKELEECRASLAQLNDHSAQYARLQRKLVEAQNDYENSRATYQRSINSQKMEDEQVGSINIIQRPTMPLGPEGVNRVRRAALGLFLGLFGAIIVAFTVEFLDNSIKNDQDVDKRLGLPVLATISREEYESCI